jgi:hypothetical protein
LQRLRHVHAPNCDERPTAESTGVTAEP